MSADRRSIDASSATGTADGDADAVVVEELETGDRLLVGEAMMMLFSSGSNSSCSTDGRLPVDASHGHGK